MSEEDLGNEITIWQEETAFTITGVKVLIEDWLYDGDIGSWPRSEAKKHLSEDEYNNCKHEVNYKKGTLILLV